MSDVELTANDMVTARPGGANHFLALDGLRGVAAIAVMVFHRRWWIAPDSQWYGGLAVDFFFILSGFVIQHAYGEKLASGRMGFGQFARLRAIRLYPLIVLGAALGIAVVLLKALSLAWPTLALHAVAAAPFAALALPTPFLTQPFDPNQPVWSLFFELIANAAFAIAAPRLSNRVLGWTIAVSGTVLAAAIIGLHGLAFGWLWPTMVLGLPRVAFPFAVGIALRRMHPAITGRVPILPLPLIALVLAGMLVMPILGQPAGVVYVSAAVFLVFPLLIASAAGLRTSGALATVASLSGEISYPVYILHFPIYALLELIPSFNALAPGLRLAIALAVILGASLAASRLYDQPLRAMLSRRFSPRPVAATA